MESLPTISSNQEELLLSNLERKLPNSIHAYCFLRNLINWRASQSSLISKVCAPNGVIEDETFVLWIQLQDSQILTAYSSTDEGSRKLADALEKTSIIDWSKYFLFTCIPYRIAKCFASVWTSKNIEVNQNPGVAYWIKPETINSFSNKYPDDITLKRVSVSDGALINSIWPHRMDGTQVLVEEIIKVNFGIGAYKKDSGELISWALHWFYGGIGLLQTVESEMGKGYAKAVISEVSKQMNADGWPVHLIVVEGNKQGSSFFSKMNATKLFDHVWIELKTS